MQAERRTTNDAPPAYGAAPSDGTAQPLPAIDLTGSRAPVATSLQSLKSPLDHAKAQLVNAYQLSLTASNEAEYSQIIQWCAAATRVELDAETRSFANNLSAWALNRRGQVRADAGEGDLALADFNAALEVDPKNWRALHNRAVTTAQRGDFAESFDDLCRVIQSNPKFAKAYANRATLYVQAGDMPRALADFDAALAAEPELLAALVGRGRVCHLLGRLDDALTSLDTAVKVAPQDADIVCSRADLLADLGRYEDALLDYAQAIDLNKKFEHAYRNGAWLLATCPDESIRDVEGAIAGAQAALDCGYGERHAALDTMAAALANAGRYEEAVGTIQQAIDIAPMEVRDAYQARQQLYEAGQPFRTQPVGSEEMAVVEATDGDQSATATASDAESAIDEHAAVYIEE
jgi:tetratricopeptide (TPR) repeat protein